jgi:hypothetical protein
LGKHFTEKKELRIFCQLSANENTSIDMQLLNIIDMKNRSTCKYDFMGIFASLSHFAPKYSIILKY